MAQRKINGAAVRAIREAVGLTQEQLARRALIKQSSLANIESGFRNAGPGTLRRIADALTVPVAAISTTPDPDAERELESA